MTNGRHTTRPRQGRAAIIAAVQTPLGFFTLAVLIVEAILALLIPGATDYQRNVLIWGMLGTVAVLILIVSVTAVFRSPHGRPYSLLIGPSDVLRHFDITLVDWDEKSCYLVGQTVRELITLVPIRGGRGFRVELANGSLSDLSPHQSYRCELRDKLGNRWTVKPFYLFENLVPLVPAEAIEKIVSDYGGKSDA